MEGALSLRCPAHSAILHALHDLGSPFVVAPLAAVTASDLSETVGQDAALLVDGGRCRFGQRPTVVRIDDDRWEVLHEGLITREQLQHELLQIWARSRVTILFVTHSVEEAALLADRVLVMSAGPGRIESDIAIDLPRPRDVSSPEFNAVRRDLARRLTSHIAPIRNLETVA